MKKNEIIWREILSQFLEKKVNKFTQKSLKEKFNFSLSTVFNALKPLREIQAIEVKARYFTIRNFESFLYFWASQRRLKKDLIYSTRLEKNVLQIESEVPPGAIYAAYSAFRQKYKDVPADYQNVYIYADELNEIQKRFPKSNKSNPNLIVLKLDKWLKTYGGITPLVQTFVDIWNLPEWYAKDFLRSLKEKMKID